ncbi:MAG: cytochrome c nitrite reductase small subunit [Helicobacteraceae bacterium]|jgi:cytochrome c nitrite reductase small subunit|nr:cytochrome c nitrite reductase small subunit [Helicobacteraceae bacterium]
MKKKKALVALAVGAFLVAIGAFFYTLKVAKATSYLSDDSSACINCHVMNVSYATWEHSAHREAAKCVDCHLPSEGIAKYIAKARDGFNHASAFTFGDFKQPIKISEDGAKRVQANCVSCHSETVKTIERNAALNHRFDEEDRPCWSCHRETPHGSVRALSAAPNTLGVRNVK